MVAELGKLGAGHCLFAEVQVFLVWSFSFLFVNPFGCQLGLGAAAYSLQGAVGKVVGAVGLFVEAGGSAVGASIICRGLGGPVRSLRGAKVFDLLPEGLDHALVVEGFGMFFPEVDVELIDVVLLGRRIQPEGDELESVVVHHGLSGRVLPFF